MQLSVVPLPPHTPLPDDDSLQSLSVGTVPDRGEIVKRLRHLGGTVLAEDLVAVGTLTPADFHSSRITPGLSDAAVMIHDRYKQALGCADDILKSFRRRFEQQMHAIAYSPLLPLSHEQITHRLAGVSVMLVDSLKTRSQDPQYDTTSRTIEIPLPLLDQSFQYRDYVHEALHALAGKCVVSVKYLDRGNLADEETLLLRNGLRFTIPHWEEYRKVFEWLDEGLVEYLVSEMLGPCTPEESAFPPAYEGEVAIITALVDPNGFYRVPLKNLTAAYFADFDPRYETGLRYPEWRDLTTALPTRTMRTISNLIEEYGAEEAATIVSSQDVGAHASRM